MAIVTATWNTGSGSWFTAANWDEPNPNPGPPVIHYVPGSNEDAAIPDVAGTQTPFTLTYNGTSTINSITGNIVGLLDITGGSLTLLQGGSSNAMGINVAAGAALSIAAGTLAVTKGDYAGTIGGDGTMIFTYGTFNLNAGVSLTLDALILGVTSNGTVSRTNLNTSLSYAGEFTLGDYSGNHAILDLHGNTLTLSGPANIDGTITGPGTVRITGSGYHGSTGNGSPIVNGGATLEYASGATAIQHLNTTLGDASGAGHLKINAGASYTIDASSTLGSGAPSVATVTNAGSLSTTGAGTDARIAAALTSTGTISVGAGSSLRIGGGYESTLGGAIGGAGALVIANAGSTLNTANVTVASLSLNGGNAGTVLTLGTSLTYGGSFAFAGQFDTLDLNARTFTLSGANNSITGNKIDGAGTLRVTGAASIGGYVQLGVSTAMTLENDGAMTQTGGVYLNGTLLNNSGHTYTIATNETLIEQGAATFMNNGTISKTAAGTGIMQGDLVNNGRLLVSAGATLVLSAGTKTLNNIVSGAGTLSLTGGAEAVLNTTTLTIGAITMNGASSLTLAKSLSYAGALTFANQFDTIDLNGFNLTLSGLANSFTGNAIEGGGTLKVTGAATIGGNVQMGLTTAMTLENAGAMTQTGGVYLRGALINTAGKTYTIAAAGEIVPQGAATFTNAGTLSVTGAGHSDVRAEFTSNGAISVSSGAQFRLSGNTALLNGTLSGAGTFELARGTVATVNIANPSIAAISLVGGVGGPTLRLGVNITYNGAFQSIGGSTVDLNGRTLTLGNVLGLDYATLKGKAAATDRLVATATNLDLTNVQFADWTPGTDTIALNGTGGINQLTGSSQADTISGLGANDRLSGLAGSDTLVGGAGDDSFINPTGDVITELAGGGVDTVESNVTFTLSGRQQVENLILTGSADIDATGNSYANALTGNAGANRLDGGTGNDTMTGGAGNDTYVVDAGGDQTIEAAGGGTDLVQSSVSRTLAANIENLTLTGTANIDGNGNTIANLINGNGGANILRGYEGADTLNGGAGNDILLGGTASDSLNPGSDTVRDIIRFAAVAESTGSQRDIVTAMDLNAEDVFDFTVLPSIINTQVNAGVLNLATINADIASAVNANLTANGAILFDPSSGDLNIAGHVYLVLDANGDGAYTPSADYLVQLVNRSGTLTLDDFI